LNQEGINNFIRSNEIETVIKNLPKTTTKAQGPDEFTDEFY
jgi:hypothetical protein